MLRRQRSNAKDILFSENEKPAHVCTGCGRCRSENGKQLFDRRLADGFTGIYELKDGSILEAHEWDDPDCPLITFSYAGNFSQLDVQTIDIDKDMSSMMVVLKDGTLIASENYYIPTETLYYHKK